MALLLIGIFGGILCGLLGIGGGSIYVPALVILVHLSQQTAQGISLSVMIPVSILGGMVYHQKNLIAYDLLKELILGGVIGAILGSFLANHVDGAILRKIFSFVLFYTGIKMLRN